MSRALKELKERMKRYSNANWSERLGGKIEEKATLGRLKELSKKIEEAGGFLQPRVFPRGP